MASYDFYLSHVDFKMEDNYGDSVTLRVCKNEPGGEAIDLGLFEDDDQYAVHAALSKKKARKLALQLLKWSESD